MNIEQKGAFMCKKALKSQKKSQTRDIKVKTNGNSRGHLIFSEALIMLNTKYNVYFLNTMNRNCNYVLPWINKIPNRCYYSGLDRIQSCCTILLR